MSSRRYDGEYALIHCLRDYLQMLPPGSNRALPNLDIRCFCPTRSTAISIRVEELFRDIAACYYSGTRPANSRYVIEIQREFYIIQFIENQPRIELAGEYKELLLYLRKAQSSYSPIILDRYCLKKMALEAISQCGRADQIQIFYQRRHDIADLYVVDEMGSLYAFSTPFFDEHSLLSPLDQFMQSMLFRRGSESSSFDGNTAQEFDLKNYQLEYYELIDSNGSIQATRINISNEVSGGNFFNVQAIGDQAIDQQGRDGNILFNIYCDYQEFSELEFGKNLFNTAAKFILSRRKSKERYPCYITDLDLSRCVIDVPGQPIQTVHYLRHKQKLEKALNDALQKI